MRFLRSGSSLVMFSFVSDDHVTGYTANFGRKTFDTIIYSQLIETI